MENLNPVLKTAIVLCGGQGTRLKPLTDSVPKSLIKVQGKPVLEYLFGLFKIHGIKDVILCVGYLGEHIEEYFGDGSSMGLNISYFQEDSPLGTAGPLRLVKEAGILPRRPFVVSNGDELKNIDLTEMLWQHLETEAKVTVALTKTDDPGSYGVANIEGDRILQFIEKPKKEEAPSNLINSGLYIFNPEVVDTIPEGKSMLEKDIFPKLAQQGSLFGFTFPGQFFDIGTKERLDIAESNWKGFT